MTITKGTLCAYFCSDGTMNSYGVYKITRVTPTKVTLTSKIHGTASMPRAQFQHAIDNNIWREVPQAGQ